MRTLCLSNNDRALKPTMKWSCATLPLFRSRIRTKQLCESCISPIGAVCARKRNYSSSRSVKKAEGRRANTGLHAHRAGVPCEVDSASARVHLTSLHYRCQSGNAPGRVYSGDIG
jgi:hypothetical protein